MVETYKGVIEANGGKVEKIEMWGVKSLAYRIKKNRKAHFTLLNVDAPPAALAEMERQMQISEDVLRFMTVRVEELESEPSAMMQKRDRDDRKDRERGRRRDDEGFGGGGFGGDRDRGDRGDRGDRPERSFGGRTKPWVSVLDLVRLLPLVVVVRAADVVPSSVVARPARSRARTLPRSTTRTSSSCRATSPSAARSCRRASRRCRPRSSVNSPRRSSAPAPRLPPLRDQVSLDLSTRSPPPLVGRSWRWGWTSACEGWRRHSHPRSLPARRRKHSYRPHAGCRTSLGRNETPLTLPFSGTAGQRDR